MTGKKQPDANNNRPAVLSADMVGDDGAPALAVTYIYALFEPGDPNPRYIGKSKAPRTRLTQHIYHAKQGAKHHCARWIRKLLSQGDMPTLEVLEMVAVAEWEEAERHHIRQHRAAGCRLVNTAPGGGCVNEGKPQKKSHRARRLFSQAFTLAIKKGNISVARAMADVAQQAHQKRPDATPPWFANAHSIIDQRLSSRGQGHASSQG